MTPMAKPRVDWQELLKEALAKGTVTTDTDLEEFCKQNHILYKDTYHLIAELQTNGTSCQGCAHIAFYDSGMYPCNACSRNKTDLYEPTS